MEKILYKRFDKHSIGSLPRTLFPGEIIVVITKEKAEEAVDDLLSNSILGFDTETKPSFKRGQLHNVALMQVSTHDKCYLFRLNIIGLCQPVIRFLTDTNVPKIGLSIHDDMHMLHRLGDFTPGNFIDLQEHAKEFGVEDLSLQKLYANFFHKRISKRERLSNWEAKNLKEAQKLYAATDAWTCIKLYEEMIRLKREGSWRTIDNTPKPEPEAQQPEEA